MSLKNSIPQLCGRTRFVISFNSYEFNTWNDKYWEKATPVFLSGKRQCSILTVQFAIRKLNAWCTILGRFPCNIGKINIRWCISSKFNWAQLYTAYDRLRPPHSVSFSLNRSYTRALLVSPNRRHLFVTPCWPSTTLYRVKLLIAVKIRNDNLSVRESLWRWKIEMIRDHPAGS